MLLVIYISPARQIHCPVISNKIGIYGIEMVYLALFCSLSGFFPGSCLVQRDMETKYAFSVCLLNKVHAFVSKATSI